MEKTIYRIFKNGSKTYFYSSIFFPHEIREDVFKLYSFVRKADDYVDSIPQKADEFYAFKKTYNQALKGEETGDIVIDSFVELIKRKDFETDWIDAFLASMEADLYVNTYPSLERLKNYLYGSAEVIGLMMAKILELPSQSYESARHLGRAMQFANFIRDIPEDITLGRIYFPQPDLLENNLEGLDYNHARNNQSGFRRFIHTQIDRFHDWQNKAEKGFSHIPKRYLIPIKTASDMYKWTAQKIERSPLIVYNKKVKPSIPHIISQISYNTIFA